jgi:hypothetical protein
VPALDLLQRCLGIGAIGLELGEPGAVCPPGILAGEDSRGPALAELTQGRLGGRELRAHRVEGFADLGGGGLGATPATDQGGDAIEKFGRHSSGVPCGG